MRNTQTGAIFAFDIQHNQFTTIKQMAAVGVDWQNLGVGPPLMPRSPLI